MSVQSDLAFAHQAELIRIADLLGNRVGSMWSQLDINRLDTSWNFIAPDLMRLVTAAQAEAVRQTTPYVNSLDVANGFAPRPAAIIPEAFTNVMGDGREVAPALYGAVTTTKKAIGGGMSLVDAFQAGATFARIVASAAVHDLARSSIEVLAAGKGYTRYVRVVGGSACSRCAILAGTYSATETAFARHVHCCCTTCPINVGGKAPTGLHDDPSAYFDSLSATDQDRVFTKAGAEAIRHGADITKVVNARRSAYGIGYSGHSRSLGGVKVPVTHGVLKPITIGQRADGTPLQVYATQFTARSQFYKNEQARVAAALAQGNYTRTISTRLMPEQIAIMANGNPIRWIELLAKYGYLA